MDAFTLGLPPATFRPQGGDGKEFRAELREEWNQLPHGECTAQLHDAER